MKSYTSKEKTLSERIGPTTINSHMSDIIESISENDARQLLKDIRDLRAYLDDLERAARAD